MVVLSKNEKRLRAVNKKIRKQKPTEGEWDMIKIESLEREKDSIINLIKGEKEKKQEKEDFEKMTADEAIEFFKEDKIMSNDDHNIPNTPETRRLRKKVLQNLNEHMMSEMMNHKLQMRMNIIQNIKKDLNEKDNSKEFLKVRQEIEDKFTY